MKFDDLTNGQTKALVAKCGGAERAMLLLRGELIVVAPPKAEKRSMKMLRPIPLSALTTQFKADETFFDTNSEVKVGYCLTGFTAWFKGLVEEVSPRAPLSGLELMQPAYDDAIIEDLGGEARAEVQLVDVWRLMQHQARGQRGALLVNGWANIFYVRDKRGVLRSLDVRWRDVCWSVDAGNLDDFIWCEDYRVFFRNS